MIKQIINNDFTEVLKEEIAFVDFNATWCMPCKAMHPIIEQLSKDFSNVNFYMVDVDINTSLARDYKIMSVPTMMIFKNGKISKTFYGTTSYDDIKENL